MNILDFQSRTATAIKRVLVQCYDNEPDILAIEERGYSDLDSRVTDHDFQLVVVIPTTAAGIDTAVVADAASEQYVPLGDTPWPGRRDLYTVRVDVTNVRYTTPQNVRRAIEAAGSTWTLQWTVRVVELDENLLYGDSDRSALRSGEYLGGGPTYPGELRNRNLFPEGAVRRVLVNAYERSPAARRRCIEHHGTGCSVCGFDFQVSYGHAAEGFIHVHHLKPLVEIGDDYLVDPINDLRPVCPNCHAVLHMRSPAYSIEEVRRKLLSDAGVSGGCPIPRDTWSGGAHTVPIREAAT